jgi:hypothetical protein
MKFQSRVLKKVIATTMVGGVIGLGVVATPADAVTASSLPSVFCSFEEPYQYVVLSPEGVLVEDHENGAVFARYKPTSVKGSINATLTVRLPASSGNSSLVLERTDGEFNSHLLTFNDREGLCDRLPTGFLLRKVVGVAEDDELNIRSEPNASAEVISTSTNGSLIWIKPTNAKWVQVAYTESIGDGAPIEVFTGWVNSRFVTKTVPRIAHD